MAPELIAVRKVTPPNAPLMAAAEQRADGHSGDEHPEP
jgi:hypothetical protein